MESNLTINDINIGTSFKLQFEEESPSVVSISESHITFRPQTLRKSCTINIGKHSFFTKNEWQLGFVEGIEQMSIRSWYKTAYISTIWHPIDFRRLHNKFPAINRAQKSIYFPFSGNDAVHTIDADTRHQEYQVVMSSKITDNINCDIYNSHRNRVPILRVFFRQRIKGWLIAKERRNGDENINILKSYNSIQHFQIVFDDFTKGIEGARVVNIAGPIFNIDEEIEKIPACMFQNLNLMDVESKISTIKTNPKANTLLKKPYFIFVDWVTWCQEMGCVPKIQPTEVMNKTNQFSKALIGTVKLENTNISIHDSPPTTSYRYDDILNTDTPLNRTFKALHTTTPTKRNYRQEINCPVSSNLVIEPGIKQINQRTPTNKNTSIFPSCSSIINKETPENLNLQECPISFDHPIFTDLPVLILSESLNQPLADASLDINEIACFEEHEYCRDPGNSSFMRTSGDDSALNIAPDLSINSAYSSKTKNSRKRKRKQSLLTEESFNDQAPNLSVHSNARSWSCLNTPSPFHQISINPEIYSNTDEEVIRMEGQYDPNEYNMSLNLQQMDDPHTASTPVYEVNQDYDFLDNIDQLYDPNEYNMSLNLQQMDDPQAASTPVYETNQDYDFFDNECVDELLHFSQDCSNLIHNFDAEQFEGLPCSPLTNITDASSERTIPMIQDRSP